MRLLNYLYCRFYQLMVSVGNGDIAAFASVAFMAFAIVLNVACVITLLYALADVKIIPSTPVALTVAACILISLYFLLVYNGKSSRIMAQYKGEDRKEWVRGRIVVIAYLVLSFAVLMASVFLMIRKNDGGL